jgi:20S proteasome alpha/beta subunit
MYTTSSEVSKKTVGDLLHIDIIIMARLNFIPGTGAVYSFDPVGSYERETCRAAGAAQSLLQPFLDNQVCYYLYYLIG